MKPISQPTILLYAFSTLLWPSIAHPTEQSKSGPRPPEELGLTAQDLSHSSEHHSTSPRQLQSRNTSAEQFHPQCYHTNTSKMGAVVRCQDYLNSIPTQECLASGGGGTWTYMCNATVGDVQAFVRARPAPGLDSASVPCSDVARGMDWILELCAPARCAGDDCVVGGTNAAWGDGDLIIEVVGNATQLSNQ